MTISRVTGPLVIVGANPAMGLLTGGPYLSGVNENPDAGPSVLFGGMVFRDQRIYSRADGATLLPGGYPNQDFGMASHLNFTVDALPSVIAVANIAALAAPVAGVAMTLVAASGAGITVETAPVTVEGTLNVVPLPARRIDAAPNYVGFGTSGAIQAWDGAAVARKISLTSGANVSTVNYTIVGYDLYGYRQTEVIAGPNVNTVNSKKAYKWITSVTPATSNAGTVSVGTADSFEFPMMARRFFQVQIYWNDTPIVASTGFTAADTTSPATTATNSPRGTYAVQSASDGTKRLQVLQTILPADLASAAGVFGVSPA